MENTFWDNVRSSINAGVAVSKDAINHYSQLGKLKIEKFQAEKRIETAFKDLGQRVYDMKKDGLDASIAADVAVESFVADIDENYAGIARLDSEITELKEREAQEEEPSSQEEQAKKDA
ncbi:hypothetical protein [Chitinivibrio alkaliphilus]|uniref:Uncharacterized protein n=1 Tax=Chitinivibrio alkaliphilus ACht1 TaxID=1313304 RepID=U7DC15_9BACT|nr:hypothetical protein [Chitinivibrio alkaliphilus]ERP39123.1 hypothetical protein CALK_0290 [Chitinivibrio alkaliphilus ACht1]